MLDLLIHVSAEVLTVLLHACVVQMLRSDSLLVTERELFVYFFTDPERLRRVVDDVSARLAAQQVK